MAFSQESLSQLTEEINRESGSWEAGYNYLLDLDADEQDKYLGYVPGPNEPSLEEQEQLAQANLESFTSSSESATVPSSIDWRNKGGHNYVTSVKNQGSCGSCVAFGALATMESIERIRRNSASYAVDYSEAHLFYCHARSEGRRCGGANGGWWAGKALDALRDKGVVDEACYPYTAGDQNCTGRCSDWASRVRKISGWHTVSSISAMKKELAEKGPMVVCFTVYSDFFAYKSGVYRKTSSATQRGGHCMSVVGYSDSERCWICKNSWGANWGDQGYVKMGYGQVGIDSTMWAIESTLDSGWVKGKKVTALWAINQERNAWVHVAGEGWKKINNANNTNFFLLLNDLIAAKAAGRTVNLRLDKGEIMEAYVW